MAVESGKKILYTGLGMSGKATSIAQLRDLGRLGVVVRRQDVNGEQYPFEWRVTCPQWKSPLPLIVSSSMLRATRFVDVLAHRLDTTTSWEVENLKRVDGIVHVIDTQRLRLEASVGFVERTRLDLTRLGRDPDDIPTVFQLNKRDLDDVEDIDNMKNQIRWTRCDYVESVAIRGEGVFEAFCRVVDLL